MNRLPLPSRHVLRVLLALGLLAAPPADAGPARLVAPLNASRTASGESGGAVFAGGGRYVFFLSDAPDIAGAASGSALASLYRRDLVSGETIAVPTGIPGAAVTGFAVSADAGRVAFSLRPPVAPADANSVAERIHVRDLATGTTTWATRPASGDDPADATSPVLSADGRWLFFESASSRLDAGDTNGVVDVYRRDLEGGGFERVSVGDAPPTAASASTLAGASGDASVVAFQCRLPIPAETGPGVPTDLYIRWPGAGRTLRLAIPADQAGGATFVRVANPSVGADGGSVAFAAAGAYWWANLADGLPVKISAGLDFPADYDESCGPVMAADGRTVVFEADGPDRIRVWMRGVGTRTLDELAGLPANPDEASARRSPVLSPDGRWLLHRITGASPRLVLRRLADGASRDLPGATGDGSETASARFGADGAWLAYSTDAALPGADDANRAADLMLVPTAGGDAAVASAREASRPARPTGGTWVEAGAASDDGRWVAVTTDSDDLVPGDANGRRDVVLLDRVTGVRSLVSAGPGGTSLRGDSWNPRVTGDGRFVLFLSTAAGLVPGDTNAVADVYVRDVQAGTTELASAIDGTSLATAGRVGATDAVISGDGRYVAFESAARDLIPGTTVPLVNTSLYLRDRVAGRTYWMGDAKLYAAGTFVPAAAARPVMSRDGAWFAYLAGSTSPSEAYLFSTRDLKARSLNLNPQRRVISNLAISADGSRVAAAVFTGQNGTVQLHDVAHGTNQTVATFQSGDIRSIVLSGDGGRLAFTSTGIVGGLGDGNAARDVFLYDVASGVLSIPSAAGTGASSDGGSDLPAFAAGGSQLVFQSRAGNLDGRGGPGPTRVVVRDLATGVAAVLSRGPGPSRSALAGAATPVPVPGGVLFASLDDALDGADDNRASDVFAASFPDFATLDADGDGLPDAWEMARFGKLTLGATDDPDGDGAGNAAEFAAGTDPSSPDSVFRAASATPTANGLTIVFKSVAGVTYQPEVSAGIDAAGFAPHGPPVAGDGGNIVVTVPVSADAGFVRIRAQR